jgi:formylglycine-generating enzyme required for sulfatase activity
MPTQPNVFISYARADGSDYADRLYNELSANKITSWRDTRNLDPYAGFDAEIEIALEAATHIVVCCTADIKRTDSFVRLEILYALENKKPIIPLLFSGGHRPLTIISRTYVPFTDWNTGFAELLRRLKSADTGEITPETRREYELQYLQAIGQRYDHWRDLYTDLAAQAQIEQQKVKLKAAAARYFETQHDIFQEISHTPEEDRSKTITVESFDELREGIRKYKRVALIGDPGAGKTTTLERLAYEFATGAAETEPEPLPLFVPLREYKGGDFEQFMEGYFGGLRLREYVPGRVFLLLDALNETPHEHHATVDHWLRRNPDVPVIVSCRKLDYVGLKLPLQRIDILPLDLERVHLFMGNFLETEDHDRLFWALSGSKTREAWAWYLREKKDATWRDFWFEEDKPGYDWYPERKQLEVMRRALREEQKLPDMLGVATNPFLLRIIIGTFSRQGEPPKNKGQLFHRFVTNLIEQRGKPAIKPDKPWIDERIQRQGLAALAYRMQAEKTGTSVEAAWALWVIREAMSAHDAELLLYFAANASIIEWGSTVRFTHQLLQEYFAAYEMGEDLRRGVPATKYFMDDDWWKPTGWEETALFLAGMQGNATSVVRWLTPVQPTLAYRCATESGADCDAAVLQPLYEPPPDARVDPIARAEWGRMLAVKGDTRPGVGLRPDGLPDIDWIEIPAGSFLIGSDQDKDPQAQKDETPQREVMLDTYHISRYPITYIQFQAFLHAADGFDRDEWWEDLTSDFRKQPMIDQFNRFDNHPRDSVSWYQAVAFTRWLTAQYHVKGLLPKGGMIRLPTESEWEKAARGTDGRIYPWGNEYRTTYANIDETDDRYPVGAYFLNRTTAVGLYPQSASPYGLMDCAGNVWEWCLTQRRSSYQDEEDNSIEGTNRRVVRGGAFRFNALNSRCACRINRFYLDLPYSMDDCFGFRVVSVPVL